MEASDAKNRGPLARTGDEPAQTDAEERRPSLIELLGRPEVRHVESGDWIYREGDRVEVCWYILLGRVAVFFAGERIHELGSEEILGAQELLVEQLEHNTSAQAIEACDLIKLSLDGFVGVLSRGGLVAFLRRAAATLEHARASLTDSRRERDKVVQQLRSALERTQDELTEKAERERKLAEENAQCRELIEKLQSRAAALQVKVGRRDSRGTPAAVVAKGVRDQVRQIIRQAALAHEALLRMTCALKPSVLVELQQQRDFVELHGILKALADEDRMMDLSE